MRKVAAVCPVALASGFALAGVDTHAYATAQEARGHIMRLLRDGDAGVVLVDDAIVDELDEATRRAIETSDLPLVITTPMTKSRALEREYLEQMIRRVIGYQVRLR